VKRLVLVVALSMAGVALSPVSAQVAAAQADDALLNVAVWGTHMPIDAAAYTGVLKGEVDAYLRRATAYHSTRPSPGGDGLLDMVYQAQVGYERRLVSVTDNPQAPRLALDYVSRLAPCYEWEGYHDCPAREARFADEYQRVHPDGPFSTLLPLLSAHRWLCAAEAYEYEGKPAEAADARLVFDQRLKDARRSKALLLRTAADRLAARKRCF
jgi:hypothetical protein